MRRNKIRNTVILPAIVIAGLLLLHFLPEFDGQGGGLLKKVNILADIMAVDEDTVDWEDEAAVEFQDSVPEGMVPIEDFADDRNNRMMDRFYEVLGRVSKMDRPIRIAYFGDSFIEGDIMTCDLRELLQNKFGGCGVGAVNVIYPFANSRGTVLQSQEGLTEHVSSNRSTFKESLQGMNNFYATFSGEAWARFTGTKNQFGSHLDKWDVSMVYFRPSGGMKVSCQTNGGEMKQVYSGKSDKVERAVVRGEASNVKWKFSGEGNVCFFAANEGCKGIVLDNFALRGATGYQHVGIPQQTLEEFAALRPYDLIIFQYGLNVAHPSMKTYKPFADNFTKIIEKFGKAWPKASIMLVSVSDRGKKGAAAGQTVTMKGVKELTAVQHDVAKTEKIAFWNMYQAMGGEGGIGRMAAAGEANHDYTHMNFKGGKKIATMLFEALMNGKENYDRRKGGGSR